MFSVRWKADRRPA